MRIVFLFILFFGMAEASFSSAPVKREGVPKVIVLGIDGLNTYRFEDAITPHFDWMKENGSWSFQTKCHQPASSSPNWSSILRGCTPAQHQIQKNGFRHPEYRKNPTCPSEPKYFPTIFTLLNRQKENAVTGMFEEWGGMRWLIRGDNLNRKYWWRFSPDKVLRKALKFYEKRHPDLVFVHLDLMDHAGHAFGHESREYAMELQHADQLLGEAIKTVNRLDGFENTFLLVVSDHGGKGNGHGGTDPKVVNTPWMMVGPGIRKGHQIRSETGHEDTAVTLAKILGLETHPCWTGKVVEEIFSDFN